MAHFCLSEAARIPGVSRGPKCKVNMRKRGEIVTIRVIPNIRDTCGDLDTITWFQDNAARTRAQEALT